MKKYHYTYPVRLSEAQRVFLKGIAKTSSTSKDDYVKARVLLMSDQSQGAPEATDGVIAQTLQISRRQVIRLKKRHCQEGLEVVLTNKYPRERPEQRCLDGRSEAQLMLLACSKAPDGATRWTLELLAEHMVKLEYVKHISHETVRQALKKTNSNRG